MDLGHDIDFVIPWVDGSDPEWLSEKSRYAGSSLGIEDDAARYRDWGLLRYWFRGVETFAPWVRKVHFVTWGHRPEWLNTSHPKLNIVNHCDYIPGEYLPTFSANTIELNFHRIRDLAEHFVYFNDDTFLCGKVQPADFFVNGLPKTTAIATPLRAEYGDWFFMPMVDNAVINRHFSFRQCLMKNPFKWINLKYGINLLRTISLLPYPYFCGIMEFHLPNALTKQAYKEVWALEEALLDSTCRHRVRSATDVNQYLIKNWQIASGRFMPGKPSVGKVFQLREDAASAVEDIEAYVKAGKGFLVCVNDTAEIHDVDYVIARCQQVFGSFLPDKSQFEL